MKATTLAMSLIAASASLALAGCDRGHTDAKDGVIQTRFPGQVTSGGLTSGQVIARSPKPTTNAAYAGGTPGIAGGAGGNTGGAALGGAVAETGQGPTSGASIPASAAQPGNKPPGDSGQLPDSAPAAGVTPVGAGTATNQDSKPAAAPGTLTGDK
ncbi:MULTISPECIES: hypothetical protein [unclassified Massilia]|uniref:hypothetical protein n=1 Tax=unclassified Massilia TaxID=2609279 RepID=UPI00177F20EB|nr:MULTISPECIES: hypothetical protein [unclassified Massilia]MBD8530064.1 hypothetical protein [Massilia sp. CFBP 13647]MBD8674107.1 hypothetical protein [Massilia sp. CFBP 13721]